MKILHWRAWLAATTIFFLGLAVGAAGTAWVGVRAFRRAFRAPATAPGFADRAAARIGADLARALELTPDESAQVQAILDQSATRLKQIRVQAADEVRAELRDSNARIAAALPPAKRAAFRHLVIRRYERLGLRPPGMQAGP